MKCLYCGSSFTPGTVIQKYCSAACGQKYRRRHNISEAWPSIEFTCAKCGRTVVTEAGKDRWTRFCSPECEKKYWRHPPHERESSRQNFRNIREYISYERRTNRQEAAQ